MTNQVVVRFRIEDRKPQETWNSILVVGEAPGKDEMLERRVFVGYSGKELMRMLTDAGLDPDACWFTNVFPWHPIGNNLKAFTLDDKAEVAKQYKETRAHLARQHPDFPWPTSYTWPALVPGHFVSSAWLGALAELEAKITEAKPNLILACGNTPLWALCSRLGISKVRGTVMRHPRTKTKILPTFHPAAVCRNWSSRPIVVKDLEKAGREAKSPEAVRVQRTIYVLEEGDDPFAWWEEHKGPLIAFDVETRWGQITEFSLAPSPHKSLVIPLVDLAGSTGSTGSALSLASERRVHEFLRWLFRPDSGVEKIYQNGVYDMQYLWKSLGIPPFGSRADTILAQHALYTEMPKSLAFLGSLLTDLPAWKQLARKARIKTGRRGDTE